MATKSFLFPLLLLSLLCRSTTSLPPAPPATRRVHTFRALDSTDATALLDCPPITPGATSGNKLPVVRPGTCGIPPVPTTRRDVLRHDNARLNTFVQKTSFPFGPSAAPAPSPLPSRPVTIPDQVGTAVGTPEFVVVVGYGTPSRQFTVIFDTGSDVSWIQCKPCSDCYPQHDPLFDPARSSSYAPIACGSEQCSLVGGQCSGKDCLYSVRYGDGSSTSGVFSTETLTLTASSALEHFEFGCGTHNLGDFGGAAGLLGLGRGQVSLATQAASAFGGGFSYCLPSFNGTAGFLTIGPQAAPKNAQFTPMVRKPLLPSFYFVDLVGINVGGTNISVPPPTGAPSVGTILDSGTVFTFLPAPFYAAVRDRFKLAMTQYRQVRPTMGLDTCYDFTGQSVIAIPATSLLFRNGAVFELDFFGILYFVEDDAAARIGCLAFAAAPEGFPVSIIGNTQQRSSEVIYDIAAERIGFVPSSC